MWHPQSIVVHFNCVKFSAEYSYKLILTYAKNYQIWLRCFEDRSKNVPLAALLWIT